MLLPCTQSPFWYGSEISNCQKIRKRDIVWFHRFLEKKMADSLSFIFFPLNIVKSGFPFQWEKKTADFAYFSFWNYKPLMLSVLSLICSLGLVQIQLRNFLSHFLRTKRKENWGLGWFMDDQGLYREDSNKHSEISLLCCPIPLVSVEN